ncbi:MAG: 3'-5' exonuclease domain-containing protein 2 [Bacteroidales bacterium]|nr:3'-5' exonuclease domain-containing protein 2 [Bacteroidales bacterium]
MFQREITKEEVAGLDLIEFKGPIGVIDSIETFESAIGQIKDHTLLGFDTETRPSFKKGRLYPTSLIQLATMDRSWIIRVSRIGYPKKLLELLSSEDIIKIGSGLNDDLRRLRSDFLFEPAGFLDLQQYVKAFQIEEKGLKKMSGIVLGRRISKSQQVSNWDADILTKAQLRYAATDAWICLEIYNALRNSISNIHG